MAKMGRTMASKGASLRLMVEHWLAPDPGMQVRVIEFRNKRSKHQCYVCVETLKPTGRLSLFFFRHPDGAWSIFPLGLERPAMRVTYCRTDFAPSEKSTGDLSGNGLKTPAFRGCRESSLPIKSGDATLMKR
jgi:hypothetical protein